MTQVDYRKKVEIAMGKKLASRHPVHHFDGDSLVVCQNAKYHKLLHNRQKEMYPHAAPLKASVMIRNLDPKIWMLFRAISLKRGISANQLIKDVISKFVIKNA